MKENRGNPLPLKSLNHISMVCRSVEESINFYQNVLGFVPIRRPPFDFDGAWFFGFGVGIHLLQAEDPDSLPKKDEINPKDNRISFQSVCEENHTKVCQGSKQAKEGSQCILYLHEDFRKLFKEKDPNYKSVAAGGKAAGEQWKSMSDADKAPYFEKANIRKKECEKAMAASLKKQDGGSDSNDDESDKSKSEVNNNVVDGSGEIFKVISTSL